MALFKRPRKFAQGDRVHVQAQQIWQILVGLLIAKRLEGRTDQVTITYGDLAIAMGRSSLAGRSIIKPLWIIGEYCKDVGLPTLNSIVINKLRGEPGDHVVLSEGRTIPQEMAAVNQFNWSEISPPSRGTLLVVWNTIRTKNID
jgi:hypothetical protein